MDVLLRCSSGKHRVRLDPHRYWAPARCPVCKTTVDPTRVRRLAAWVAAGCWPPGGPGRRHRPAWLVGWVTWAYLALAVLTAAFIWGLGDRWWPATIVLFGPRWLLLLPLALLVPAAAVVRRPLLAVQLVTAMVVLFPVMGFRTGWRTWLAPRPTGARLKIVTFNVDGGEAIAPLLPSMLRDWEPDLVAFQECGEPLVDEIQRLEGWYHREREGLCFVSRFPISSAAAREEFFLGDIGSTGSASRYDLLTPAGNIHYVNVHLETPRKGLEPLLGSGNLARMTGNTTLRDLGSRRIRAWVDSIPGALLVSGDFNMPVESAIYRRYWGDLGNAFSQAGHGVGGSRAETRVGVRIDHVLFGKGWRPLSARLGPDFGTDHRPMFAELEWVGTGTTP